MLFRDLWTLSAVAKATWRLSADIVNKYKNIKHIACICALQQHAFNGNSNIGHSIAQLQ